MIWERVIGRDFPFLPTLKHETWNGGESTKNNRESGGWNGTIPNFLEELHSPPLYRFGKNFIL